MEADLHDRFAELFVLFCDQWGSHVPQSSQKVLPLFSPHVLGKGPQWVQVSGRQRRRRGNPMSTKAKDCRAGHAGMHNRDRKAPCQSTAPPRHIRTGSYPKAPTGESQTPPPPQCQPRCTGPAFPWQILVSFWLTAQGWGSGGTSEATGNAVRSRVAPPKPDHPLASSACQTGSPCSGCWPPSPAQHRGQSHQAPSCMPLLRCLTRPTCLMGWKVEVLVRMDYIPEALRGKGEDTPGQLALGLDHAVLICTSRPRAQLLRGTNLAWSKSSSRSGSKRLRMTTTSALNSSTLSSKLGSDVYLT